MPHHTLIGWPGRLAVCLTTQEGTRAPGPLPPGRRPGDGCYGDGDTARGGARGGRGVGGFCFVSGEGVKTGWKEHHES